MAHRGPYNSWKCKSNFPACTSKEEKRTYFESSSFSSRRKKYVERFFFHFAIPISVQVNLYQNMPDISPIFFNMAAALAAVWYMPFSTAEACLSKGSL